MNIQVVSSAETFTPQGLWIIQSFQREAFRTLVADMEAKDLRGASKDLRETFQRKPRRAAPEDRGKRLATLSRGDVEELRVSWDGRPPPDRRYR